MCQFTIKVTNWQTVIFLHGFNLTPLDISLTFGQIRCNIHRLKWVCQSPWKHSMILPVIPGHSVFVPLLLLIIHPFSFFINLLFCEWLIISSLWCGQCLPSGSKVKPLLKYGPVERSLEGHFFLWILLNLLQLIAWFYLKHVFSWHLKAWSIWKIKSWAWDDGSDSTTLGIICFIVTSKKKKLLCAKVLLYSFVNLIAQSEVCLLLKIKVNFPKFSIIDRPNFIK